MITIDRLSYNSRLRYIHTGEKVVFSMIPLVLCVASRSILLAAVVFVVMGILTVKKGGIPLLDYLRLLTVPLLFLVMNAVILGISISKTPMELFAVPFGTWYLTAGKETVYYGICVFLTAMAAVSCMYFLACNTTMTDLLIFLRKVKCPSLVMELMLLIYRFIFVLLDCAHSIALSQHSRLGYGDYKTSLRSFGMLVSSLFVRSVKRSSALFDAMESRAYDGVIQVLEEECPVNKKELAGIIVFEAFLIVLLWMER